MVGFEGEPLRHGRRGAGGGVGNWALGGTSARGAACEALMLLSAFHRSPSHGLLGVSVCFSITPVDLVHNITSPRSSNKSVERPTPAAWWLLMVISSVSRLSTRAELPASPMEMLVISRRC